MLQHPLKYAISVCSNSDLAVSLRRSRHAFPCEGKVSAKLTDEVLQQYRLFIVLQR